MKRRRGAPRSRRARGSRSRHLGQSAGTSPRRSYSVIRRGRPPRRRYHPEVAGALVQDPASSAPVGPVVAVAVLRASDEHSSAERPGVEHDQRATARAMAAEDDSRPVRRPHRRTIDRAPPCGEAVGALPGGIRRVEPGIGRHLVCDHQAAARRGPVGQAQRAFQMPDEPAVRRDDEHTVRRLFERRRDEVSRRPAGMPAASAQSPKSRSVSSNRAGLEAAREAIERDPSPVRRPGGSSAGALAPDPAEPDPVRRDGVEAVADERDSPSVGRPPRPGLVSDPGSREAELPPVRAVRVHRHQVVVVPRVDRDEPLAVGGPVGTRAGAYPADATCSQVEHGDLLTSGAWGIERDPGAVRGPGGIFVVSADRREGGPCGSVQTHHDEVAIERVRGKDDRGRRRLAGPRRARGEDCREEGDRQPAASHNWEL